MIVDRLELEIEAVSWVLDIRSSAGVNCKMLLGLLKDDQWSKPHVCVQRFSECWPQWMCCEDGSRALLFGQYELVSHMTSSVQYIYIAQIYKIL